ncbi:MAG: polyprenyl synthetase family protein, partial [Ruminiclostridium sp.]|nr:polyprenyl synthetase family protein [Ruminiclostridium sp.]
VSAENTFKMFKMLSWCAGAVGMIGGQQIDTEFEGQPFSEEELLQMYRLKTSRLLQGAVCMGCLSADADDDTVKNAFKYADRLGLAFQIIDDILDVCGDEKDLGKPIGSDKENNKTTYVTLVGLDGAKKKAELLTEEAMSILDKFENDQFLKQLTLKLLNRNK